MAICERISRAMHALEEECTWADCFAQSLMLTTDAEPAWVSMHVHQVRQLVERANALVEAINGGDQ